MKTTLNEIMKFYPCKSGLAKVPEVYLNNPDKEIDFKDILKIAGVEDTFWCLRTQKYRDICLILADIAESVLHLYTKKYPNDSRIKDYIRAIKAIRDYKENKIPKEELKRYRLNAAHAANAAADAAADAAAHAAAHAADAAAYAATSYTAAADAAAAAADAAANAAAADAAASYTASRKKQWEINETILLKYI